MSYQPIENYGIIGNMRTVALVGMNGSIDWYCYPQFDSPSIFGAILDDKKGGRFQISAGADGVRHKQFIGLPRTCWLRASCWQTESPSWKTSCR
jgi:GH15 family glucan-1,4-alpha-glucosidase